MTTAALFAIAFVLVIIAVELERLTNEIERLRKDRR